MKGLFGDLFDFNHDGKLGILEQAAEMDFLQRMLAADKPETQDPAFNMDFEDDDTEFDFEESELEAAGIDAVELEFMDEDERRETLEMAGLDPDDFDF